VTEPGDPGAERVLPFGAWPSVLSPAAAAAGAVRIAQTSLDADPSGRTVLRWSELRPSERGRVAVRRVVLDRDGSPLGPPADDGPPTVNARSGVNEYGGGAWFVDDDRLVWCDGATQAWTTVGPDDEPVTLTPAPPVRGGWRFASGSVTPDGRWIVCEREVHPGSEAAGAPLPAEPANELCAVPVAGGAPHPLVDDADFQAAPTLSPDGTVLAWLRWEHPDMPWDGAEVWAARLVPDADGVPELVDARRVAGGAAAGARAGLDRPIAACLPAWSPDGRLWWCDDRDDWWQLRRSPSPGLPGEGAGDDAPATPDVPGEVGEPRWVAGGRRFGFTDDGRVVLVIARDGTDGVHVWDPATDRLEPAPGPRFTAVEHLSVRGSVVAVAGGAGDLPTSAWTIDLRTGTAVDHRPDAVRPDRRSVSMPEPVTFPTTGGAVAHGLMYRPRSAGVRGPEDERPPLLVRIHGGPTAAARAEYSTSVQFWTTRGFAVLDVDYRGSTGYGRRYRDLLRGAWGVADVEDCIAAARWLAAEGTVDGARCVIRGGSAGGFTALAALSHQEDRRHQDEPRHHDDRPDAFAAACSLYGVTDLRTLAEDTHKFESRYLDGLVGPWPEAAERYEERSPLHHADRLRRPVLLLQGAEDQVVPRSQAEALRDALAEGSVPHALVVFEGEAHGFRRAETIVAALQAELAFYGQVLGFTPADDLPELVLDR
jgi:dipeptidyl aminopeptidase/acylaminoacyl peptidase